MSEELRDRLRDTAEDGTSEQKSAALHEAADALERAERVVELVRAILRDEQNDEQSDLSYDHLSSRRYDALNRIRTALAAHILYDTTRADPTPKTYEFVKSLYAHECRYGCDSKWAVNCNCAGKCKKHDTTRADTVRE